tara:strand:- start:703 stop:1473 length:771 start_codon:yes stop_codon:yes gene_type:complete
MTLLDEFVKTWPIALLMPGTMTTDAKTQLDGLLAWWTLAGVDAAVSEESVNWLRPRPSPVAVHSASNLPQQGFPDTLSAFRKYLATTSDLPEKAWPGQRVLPTGPQSAPLMLIVHAPDADAQNESAHFSADATRLLERMMRAIGFALSDCYIASLSIVAPPGGTIEPAAMAALAERMRHHISLVGPRALLLLGDQTNRALLPTGDHPEAGNLPFVNHRDGIVPAASIIHPRLMLNQPMAKASAWRSLRRLIGDWGQ